jgi:hypothetical protein
MIVKLQHQQVHCSAAAAAAAACVMFTHQTIRRADGAAGEEAGHISAAVLLQAGAVVCL